MSRRLAHKKKWLHLRNYLICMSHVVSSMPVKRVECTQLESVLQRMVGISMHDQDQLAVFIRIEMELMSMHPLVRRMYHHTMPTSERERESSLWRA